MGNQTIKSPELADVSLEMLVTNGQTLILEDECPVLNNGTMPDVPEKMALYAQWGGLGETITAKVPGICALKQVREHDGAYLFMAVSPITLVCGSKQYTL